MKLFEQIKNAGVVGAGGAGFPTHIKLQATAEWYIANRAECEPLLHKDRELMVHFAREIIHGLELSAQSVKAEKVAIGIKEKNAQAMDAIRQNIQNSPVQIQEFGDFYPSGDEYELVY